MAGEKTEKPSDKKIRDELKKGNVAQSKEVTTFTALAAILILVAAIMPGSAGKFTDILLPFIDTPHDIPVSTFGDALAIVYWTAGSVGAAFGAFAFTVFALGLVGSLAQGKTVFALERVRPKLNKISVLSGFKRLFSMGNFVEFLKGIAKIATICVITALVLIPHYGSADRMVGLPPEAIGSAVRTLVTQLLIGLLVFSAVISLLDRLYKRHEWEKKIRMSKQDLKDEHKQSDGDPMLKAKRRDKARMIVKQQMMSKVPTATFVLTNPTHYSVALKYVPGETDAPICVAKGVDNVAFKIREIALTKEIPVIENPALTRALHAASELDKAIPEEHFEAVAKVVTFVMGLRDKKAAVRFPGAID